MRTVTVRIEGRVQGVWYRGWTVQEASRRGLAGWVRNRSDRSVEALFHGPAALVEDMVEACRRGPPSARVDRLSVSPATPPGGTGFLQLPTQLHEYF
ncbi:MAG: acylphosphatase [Alphaproteobacteria bacterium]